MISELFIDMDGCVSNFAKRYRELYKAEPEEHYLSSNNKKRKFHQENFHNFVENEHFSNLELMPDAHIARDFLEWINKEHNIPVCFLTSSAKEEYLNSVTDQKRKWLKDNGFKFHPIVVPGKRFKYYYSKPNRILVDDTHSNIEDWKNSEGIGIHHSSWNDSIEKIMQHL